MIFTPSASFTRPADTTAYAQNDLVANSTTAASVVPMSFGLNASGRWGIIRGARLYKSGTTVTSATFTVFLFTASPGTPTNGDNGAFGVASSAGFLDSFAIDLATGALAGGTTGVKKRSAALAIPFCFPTANSKLYALLRADAAYTPASSETFELTLEIEVARG
jgi:hypothetical protein